MDAASGEDGTPSAWLEDSASAVAEGEIAEEFADFADVAPNERFSKSFRFIVVSCN